MVHRLNEKWDINSLPDNIRNDDNIKIFLVDDIGPITKFLPTFRRVKDINSIIIKLFLIHRSSDCFNVTIW